jgi:ribosomal protein L7/L12
MSNGAYDSQTLRHIFGQVGERLAAIEAQLAILSEKAGVPYERPSEGVPQEIVDLVHAGNKLEAIRQYRILTGASLADAQKVVELL